MNGTLLNVALIVMSVVTHMDLKVQHLPLDDDDSEQHSTDGRIFRLLYKV